jgi:2-keto-3-deoxy-L-rhamnonate aldolase RhmA
MRENRIRSLWKSGGAAVNGWLAIPSVFSAETMAHQGWDSLTIDLQHGVVDYQAAVAMLAIRDCWAPSPISKERTVARARQFFELGA